MIDLDPDLLPASAREIAATIGLAGTLKLIEHYGGIRVYVPAAMPAEHHLVPVLGLTGARALAGQFGGEMIDVPRAAAAVRDALYRQIAGAYSDGVSPKVLARRHGCTERWVYIIAARMLREPAVSPQTSLFEG